MSESPLNRICAIKDAEIARCADDSTGRTYKLAIENFWNGIEPVLIGDAAIRKDAGASAEVHGTSPTSTPTSSTNPDTLNDLTSALAALDIPSHKLDDAEFLRASGVIAKSFIEAYVKVSPCEIPVNKIKHVERKLNGRCASNRDGDCDHSECPQNRDGEPLATGRSCPLYDWEGELE